MKNDEKIISIKSPKDVSIRIGKNTDLVLITGPCAIESYDHSMRMAELISKICNKLKRDRG